MSYNSSMNKILYLEDDINLNKTITEFLEDNYFKVVSVYDSKEALSRLYNEHFDLLILDINVPYINGFELSKELKNANINIPSIFTTSLNRIEDLEKGYKSGCDDYLKKPFELKELLFRIKSLLKRDFNTFDDIVRRTAKLSR